VVFICIKNITRNKTYFGTVPERQNGQLTVIVAENT
jgi:hypothetical protein